MTRSLSELAGTSSRRGDGDLELVFDDRSLDLPVGLAQGGASRCLSLPDDIGPSMISSEGELGAFDPGKIPEKMDLAGDEDEANA